MEQRYICQHRKNHFFFAFPKHKDYVLVEKEKKKKTRNKVAKQTEGACSLWPWAVHWQRGTGVHAAGYRLRAVGLF